MRYSKVNGHDHMQGICSILGLPHAESGLGCELHLLRVGRVDEPEKSGITLACKLVGNKRPSAKERGLSV